MDERVGGLSKTTGTQVHRGGRGEAGRSSRPNAVDQNIDLEEEHLAHSQNLEHWLEQLRLEKTPSSRELQPLNDNAEKLFKAWKDFQQHLSAEERDGLNNHHPTWADVQNTVERVQASWLARKDGMYETAIARLRKALENMHHHKEFLKMVPQSNNYASLFCGSFLVLIKASATYRKVAEGFSRAIFEVNEIVGSCNTERKLFAGNDLREMAVIIYCRIFQFLGKAMSWYTGSRAKRFINAFKEDAYEAFESDIIEIRRLSHGFSRRVQQGMLVENRTTNLIVQETRQDLKEIKELFERWTPVTTLGYQLREMDEITPSLHPSKVKVNCTELLADRSQVPGKAQNQDVKVTQAHSSRDSDATRQTVTKTRLQQSFGGFCRKEKSYINLVTAGSIGKTFVETHVATSLHKWLSDNSSPFLCIAGPRQSTTNLASRLATAVCASVTQSSIPLIQGSCILSPGGTPNDSDQTVLVRLVYSLIAQLIDILPEDYQSAETISIADLDGTTQTLGRALRVLAILLRASPSPLFCVIDNFQCLERPSKDNSNLSGLLNVLQEHGRQCKTSLVPRPLKVLFTTSGRSMSLLKELEPRTIVMIDQLVTGHAPGSTRRRQQPLSPTTLARFLESFKIKGDVEIS